MTIEAQNPAPQSAPAQPSPSSAPSAAAPSPSPASPAPSAAQPAPGSTTTNEAAKPPEGLDVRFWDAEKGQLKAKEFAAYAKEIEDFRAAEAVRTAAVPEKPDGYKLEVPADLKLPDGFELDMNPDLPQWKAAREFAHVKKLDQAGFNDLVKTYASVRAQEIAADRAAVSAEMEKLGSNGKARIDAVATALRSLVGPERGAALALPVSSAAGLEALEMLVSKATGSGIAAFNQNGRAAPEGGIPEDEYARMSPAQRLAKARELSGRKA